MRICVSVGTWLVASACGAPQAARVYPQSARALPSTDELLQASACVREIGALRLRYSKLPPGTRLETPAKLNGLWLVIFDLDVAWDYVNDVTITLDGELDDARREALRAAGATIEEPIVPGFGYLATIPVNHLACVAELGFVKTITETPAEI